ncbi:MAG TPA: hypothetical protein VKQ27_09145 [Acetobacteraceae bacterium]|nr:hypothetical protein [Acetobacteraceae bacterium]
MGRPSAKSLRVIAELRGIQETAASLAAGAAAARSRSAREALLDSDRRLGELHGGWEASRDGKAIDIEAGLRWSAAWRRAAGDNEHRRDLLLTMEKDERASRSLWEDAMRREDAATSEYRRAQTKEQARIEETRLQEVSERFSRLWATRS